MPDFRGPSGSSREVQDALMREASEYGHVCPGTCRERSLCKVLVKRGLFEPNDRLGYRLTPLGLERLRAVTEVACLLGVRQ